MRFFKDVLLTAAAAMAVLSAVEGLLRLGQVHFNARLYQPERGRGYGLRPYGEGWYVGEGETWIRINSQGMRDIERPVRRPADTLRVAVLGSCEAEARQVALEQTLQSVMRRNLAGALAARGGHVDVLNFGVTGHALSQEYVTLRDHVFQYDPQVVVLLLQPFNYLKNTRDLYPGDPHETPFYVVENGRLTPDAITRNMPAPDPRRVQSYNRIANLMNGIRLAGLANAARLELARQVSEWRAKLRPVNASAAGPVRADFEYLRYAPDRAEAQESWSIGDALVEAMRAECDRHGVEFRIVTVDVNEATHPDPAAAKAFCRRMGVATLDAAERRIGRFCEARGIPLLVPGPALLEYARAHHTFLHGDPAVGDNQGFWNALGNEVMGGLMSRDLMENSRAVQEWRPAGLELKTGSGPGGVSRAGDSLR